MPINALVAIALTLAICVLYCIVKWATSFYYPENTPKSVHATVNELESEYSAWRARTTLVPAKAPAIDIDECRPGELQFVMALNAEAQRLGWSNRPGFGAFPIGCYEQPDHLVIGFDFSVGNQIHRSYRIDYLAGIVMVGRDETCQFVTQLDPADPHVLVMKSGTPEEMARAAAARIELAWEKWRSPKKH